MTGRSTSRRALVAGGVGNVVEWYDFAVYGAFATVIATTYFPGADPVAGLSASFAVFATAFLARPVGAVVFGRLGDRVGRRQVLVTVIVLMAAATAGIGLLPGHAAIGVLAPVLLVVFRAAQGLSVGGEAAGATAFVVEYAPEGRRGWYGSWLWSTLALGVAGGIGVAVLLARVFPREVLEDRGWRLAFLVALPLGLVGLYLRLRLDETPRFRALERADATVRRPVAATLRTYPGRLLLGLAPVAAASLAFNPAFLLIRGAEPAGLVVGYLLVARPLPPSTPSPSPSWRWPRPWRPGRPRSGRWIPPTCPRRSWPGPDASSSSLPGDASPARQGFHDPWVSSRIQRPRTACGGWPTGRRRSWSRWPRCSWGPWSAPGSTGRPTCWSGWPPWWRPTPPPCPTAPI